MYFALKENQISKWFHAAQTHQQETLTAELAQGVSPLKFRRTDGAVNLMLKWSNNSIITNVEPI